MNTSHFMGRDGFFWWIGTCEDRIDPEKLGRVKVRILGSHTPDKAFIKTEDLLWAYPFVPITSASMNGLGQSPLGVVPGTWVFGFYRDGKDMQEPIVMGSFGGIPQDPANNTIGFNDPRDSSGTPETLQTAPRKIETRVYPFDGSGAHLTPESEAQPYPREIHPLGCILKEPDTNRIARAENISDTIIQTMIDMLDKNVPIAFGGTWSEPNVWYKGQYPFVHTYESESGHIKVVDDTPSNEGTLEWDRTGSFKEVLTDGSEVLKIVKNGYTIILSKNNIHIMNDQNERCDKEYNLSVGGRWNVEVSGNINIYSHSSIFVQSNGSTNISAGGNVDIGASGDVNVKADGNINAQAGGDVNVKTGGSVKITAGAKIGLIAGGNVDIKAGGHFAVDATQILLNMGAASPSPAGSAESPTKPKQ